MTSSTEATTVTEVLGSLREPRFAGRPVDPLPVSWGDAGKHRRVARTRDGRELALRLPRRSFLADGDVLCEDGDTVVAVTRPPEDAIVLRFADNGDPDAVRAALLLGYLLGNQHAPLDVSDAELRTPLMTGPDTAHRMLAELGLRGAVRPVPLAAHGWYTTSADRHGHGHDHAG